VISDGSIVEGNVKGKGVSTTITESFINGNVDSNKETTVIILDSTIDGNLKVNNGIIVEVSRNIVDGNLKIKNTLDSCIDIGNAVNGDFDGCP
jgi:hypothetical protein